MAKHFNKEVLNRTSQDQLLALAKTWKIKKLNSNKDKLIEQLYNHQNNQTTKKKSNHPFICKETKVACCTVENCSKHPQSQS